MSAPYGRPASYQDVLDAPTHQVAEVVNGELHISPRPAGPHTAVASALGSEITGPFGRGRGGPGGWLILDEPELHLGRDILVPGVAGWRRERMAMVDDVAYFTVAPDWLCEVLSPSTEKLDRARKLPAYAAAGVSHVWLINPRTRTLEVLRRQGFLWVVLAVHEDDQKLRAEPFEALEIELSVLWSDLAPKGRPTRASEPFAAYGEPAAEDLW